MATFTANISTGADDGHSTSAPAFSSTASGVIFGNDGNSADAFFRFQNVTIPQGANISAATIQFQALTTRSTATCQVKIFCNAADNATAPTDRTSHVNKTRTTAFSDWNPVPVQTADLNYTTPDFSSAVQEVINRAGWASGNALMVLIDNNGSSTNALRQEKAFESSSSLCALLSITYTLPSPSISSKKPRAFILGE